MRVMMAVVLVVAVVLAAVFVMVAILSTVCVCVACVYVKSGNPAPVACSTIESCKVADWMPFEILGSAYRICAVFGSNHIVLPAASATR